MSDSIKVAVRLRKPSDTESENFVVARVQLDNYIDIQSNRKDESKRFKFDYCATYLDDANQDQEQVYNCLAREYLLHALDGYNTCIFAYGQTGSGKSHTMSGCSESPGIVPRMCRELFEVRDLYELSDEQVSPQFSIKCSYFEIYNETVRDLLGECKCKIRERADKTTFVEGLKEFEVFEVSDMLGFFKQGNERRVVGATHVNGQSSRSHAIFTIQIEQRETTPLGHILERKSSIKLIDLAGSERATASKTSGDHLKEGANINKSLSTLGRVISMLAKTKKPLLIPYRDAALTWVLKENLGGNSKTCMIACVSPCDYEETMSTIRYATLARSVKTSAKLNSNELFDGKEQVQVLRSQLEELRKALSQVENQRAIDDKIEKIHLTNQFLEARIEREQKLTTGYYDQWVQAAQSRDRLMQLLAGIVSSVQDTQVSGLREKVKRLKLRSTELGEKIQANYSATRSITSGPPCVMAGPLSNGTRDSAKNGTIYE
ncbi:LAME_0G13894g1_1 [Lachancea meyersii CBS 8951]|uniref:Kinesin-like protein n=1 Tax=Lachancea meyersii CBS 8951 TaxID=1266667 RepID=A0A1G4KA95_9SACH|nr:LAME_0G13894g1_1 [Lachancea meyersii CBS 8951]